VNRRDRLAGTHLQAFDRALDWAEIGRKLEDEGRGGPRSIIGQSQKSAR
jgi:hypothetical protein